MQKSHSFKVGYRRWTLNTRLIRDSLLFYCNSAKSLQAELRGFFDCISITHEHSFAMGFNPISLWASALKGEFSHFIDCLIWSDEKVQEFCNIIWSLQSNKTFLLLLKFWKVGCLSLKNLSLNWKMIWIWSPYIICKAVSFFMPWLWFFCDFEQIWWTNMRSNDFLKWMIKLRLGYFFKLIQLFGWKNSVIGSWLYL